MSDPQRTSRAEEPEGLGRDDSLPAFSSGLIDRIRDEARGREVIRGETANRRTAEYRTAEGRS